MPRFESGDRYNLLRRILRLRSEPALNELKGQAAQSPVSHVHLVAVPRVEEALAEAVALSPRHFSRVFAAEVGETPARFVERVRVEAARRVLELSDAGLGSVARDCGFGTAETLRRAFHRRLGVSPNGYRQRFRIPETTNQEVSS